MSFNIDQSLSLMIPRVFPQWIDEQKIIDVFQRQKLGRVYKVNIVRSADSKKRSFPIYQAFVYFSAWYDNKIAYNFQQRIFGAKKQARIVYDDPWYWVVFENIKRRLSNNDKRIMRVGYQTYAAEQYMLEQDERIQRLENILENFPEVHTSGAGTSGADTSGADTSGADTSGADTSGAGTSESHLRWNNISVAFVMETLGDELSLTETAMNVAEAALYEDDESSPMDISLNSNSENWTEPVNCSSWLSHQQTQLEATAVEVLGAELNLTETAINVAERVLMETDEEAELNLTETAINVAKSARVPMKEERDEEYDNDERHVEDYYQPEEFYEEYRKQEEDYDY